MKFTSSILILIALLFALMACSKDVGVLLLEPAAPIPPTPPTPFDSLIILSSDANHSGVARYDINGNLIEAITSFRSENAVPRGLALFDLTSFIVSVDTTDALYSLDFDGQKTVFHSSANLNGIIWDIEQAPNGNYYVIESNHVEVFDPDGVRVDAAYIDTITGSCTLSAPRGLDFNSSGQLVVSNVGGTILVYDISGPAATCVSSVALGNNPYGVVVHSDGYLYVTTQANHSVYRTDADGSNPTVIWNTNISIIREPTDILELPNGNLLVSSVFTDTIEEIRTNVDDRVGTTPFIKDSNSLYVNDMLIVPGE